ncbi:MAG: 30S ribosomal protein S4 [candidate division Zixibacteria bacterium CG_4_9_14_3_um_filter_46_8]|nr:MAG: 30S ribosomal protein S4 [candidate division Zixibacteria bacterium CG_4_9_14_3_um_filter_46_8]
MARYTDANCKLCRREGQKLFLKGARCYSEKCAFDRRPYAPGQHGQTMRRKVSEYGLQLREKQKVRRIYGVFEKQFRNYFKRAERGRGITGENLLVLLESRLDNIVYRLGFAPSRKSARQLVLHEHFSVNGKTVNVPSFNLRPKDIIKVREKSANLEIIHEALKSSGRGTDLAWLRVDKAKLEGEILEIPRREEIPVMVQEQLIVELYSK